MVTDMKISVKWYKFNTDDERLRNLLVASRKMVPFNVERVNSDTVKVWFYEKNKGNSKDADEIHFVPTKKFLSNESNYVCEYVGKGDYIRCKLSKQPRNKRGR